MNKQKSYNAKIKDEEKKIIKDLKIDNSKIIFKTSVSWSICLGSNIYDNIFFYLKNNLINRKKIEIITGKKIDITLKEDENNFKEPILREYQKEDVNFLSKFSSAAIFNETRTGKTPIALILINKVWKVKKIIIIVPIIVQNQWQEEIKQWINKPSFILTNLNKENRFFL